METSFERRTPTTKWRHLPDPVDEDRLVTSAEASPVPDPDGGLDPQTRFMLSYAG